MSKLKWNLREFAALRHEAERELDKIATEAVADLNDASSWGGYHLHNTNDAYGPGRALVIDNATSERMDRASALLSGAKIRVTGTRPPYRRSG